MGITLDRVKTIGSGLIRPEGVMALDDGGLYTADARGRCSHIEADGRTSFFGKLGGLPNGICVDEKGNCIVANIGNGEVELLSLSGESIVLMTEAEGKRMPAPNFPFIDFKGRLWVSNSTVNPDIDASLQRPVPDGSLVMIAPGKLPVIAAEGIYFANGVALDLREEYVYVAETMKRRILRYRINSDTTLGKGEVYGPEILGELGFPDGIAFDEEGNLWVAFPAANSIGYIKPDGGLEIFVHDPLGTVIRHPANICFGGKDRRTAFIGSLGGNNIPFFKVPYPGVRLVHQNGGHNN